MRRPLWLTLLVALVLFGGCMVSSGRPAHGQVADWSSWRTIAQPGISCVVVRAPKDAAGHIIGPSEPVSDLEAQAPDRVVDFPLAASWQYVQDCHFTATDGVIYEGYIYLPIVGGKYRAR